MKGNVKRASLLKVRGKEAGIECEEVHKQSRCPFINRPKIIKLNRLEEFCAVLVWNG